MMLLACSSAFLAILCLGTAVFGKIWERFEGWVEQRAATVLKVWGLLSARAIQGHYRIPLSLVELALRSLTRKGKFKKSTRPFVGGPHYEPLRHAAQ